MSKPLPGLLLAALVLGQAQNFEFDAATIREVAPGSGGMLGNMTGGLGSTDPERVRYHGTPLSLLLAEAFHLRIDQVIAPDWVQRQCYDVVAKIPPGATREQYEAMLRRLLVDRLHISSHLDRRTFKAYDLVVAKGGVKMKLSTADAPAPVGVVPADPAAAATQRQNLLFSLGSDRDGFPALPGNNIAAMKTTSIRGRTRSNARGQTTTAIAQMLEVGLGSGVRVTDKTGLTGRYDFKLEYAGTTSADPDGLQDVFSAVQSQLGLKLENSTVQSEVLIIDHIEKTPTNN